MAKIDRKKLAIIHILKKELRLSDEEYRLILKRITGVTSAKDLSGDQYTQLMRYLVGQKGRRAPQVPMTAKQRMYINFLVKDLGWDSEQLSQFLLKYYHQHDPAKLTKKDAIKVIESLKNVLIHKQNEDADAA